MLVVDIDGCVFDNNHRKNLIPKVANSPACWARFNDACDKDLPVYTVINFVNELSKAHGQSLNFVTSRGETSYESTTRQLQTFFSDFKLYMRPMSDNRHTVDYKRSVFAKMPLTKNSVIIDDHPGIIQMVKNEFSYVNALLVQSHDCTVGISTTLKIDGLLNK